MAGCPHPAVAGQREDRGQRDGAGEGLHLPLEHCCYGVREAVLVTQRSTEQDPSDDVHGQEKDLAQNVDLGVFAPAADDRVGFLDHPVRVAPDPAGTEGGGDEVPLASVQVAFEHQQAIAQDRA